MLSCKRCGAEAEPGQRFCESCGGPLREDPGYGPEPRGHSNDLAEYWLAAGMERDGKMDVAGAIDAYDKALTVRKDFYEAIFNRGFDLVLLGRYEEADAAFARAIEIRPDDAFALKYRALALHELGKREEARVLIARARELKPEILDV